MKDEAIQDMLEAFDWYESKQAGLGTEFLNEVDEYQNRISQNPQQYQIHKSQHIAVMHRFPFKIVYEIEGETIVVYAVYHDKRNPETITGRL
ncbi:MAG TPA: type II toxin-antitoxin system RelE/ParE family toxin [Cyclobacteriaceae bacterium]|nr:type II toxin-antitoxin system RelE/ParE family toxin [Cyclobacteriaceae bacterium]